MKCDNPSIRPARMLALAAAALMIYPHTPWMKTLGL